MGGAPAGYRTRRGSAVLPRRLRRAYRGRAGERGPRPRRSRRRAGRRVDHHPHGRAGRIAERRDGGGGAVLRGRPSTRLMTLPAGPVINLNLLPDAVLQLDADRRLVAVNEAASALTGYRPEEMLGHRVDDLLDPRRLDGRPARTDGWHPSSRLRSVV